MAALSLTPSEVTSALESPARLAAVRRLESLTIPTEEIQAELEALADILGGEGTLCAATYVDDGKQHFLATSDGPFDALDRQVSHCQYVIATGAWICLEDATMPVGPLLKVRRALLRGTPIGAYLGFPLNFDREPVGAVCAVDMHERAWTSQEHYAVYRSSVTVSDILAAAARR